MLSKSKVLPLIALSLVAIIIGVLYYFKPINPSTGNDIINPPLAANFKQHKDLDIPSDIKQKFEEKRKEYQDKIAKNEDLKSSYFELAVMENNLGNLKEAVDAYNASIKITDGALLRNNIADVYAEAEDYKSAEANYRKAIEINPSNAVYYRKLADFIYGQFPDRRSEVKQVYLDGIKNVEETHKIDVITPYARYLDNMGDYEESLHWWQQALILVPNNQSFRAEVDALNAKIAEKK